MKEKNLIFDIDGTLWDSRGIVAQGYNKQLAAEGLAEPVVTPELLSPLFGKTTSDIADSLFPHVPLPERYALMDRCMEAEHREMERDPCRIAFPGVVETLEKLAQNHNLFIVSNSQQGYPELTMRKMGIGHLIRATLCYGDTGKRKGQTILQLRKEQGMDSALYIGDTQGDDEATLEAGIPFVSCTYGFGNPAGWAAKFDSFPELLELEL